MDIELFLEFVMIGKYGNLSEASRELKISQPALSRHLSQLERFAGTELFDRSKTPMELTYTGEVFLKRCSEIYTSYAKLQAFVNKTRSTRIEKVRVSGIVGMLDAPIAAKLRAAKSLAEQEDSQLFVKFIASPPQTPFDALREGEIEVAIEPASSMVDTRLLDSFPIARERTVIVLETTNPLSERDSFGEQDLDSLRFVTPKSNADYALRKHLQDLCKRYGPKDALPKVLSIANVNTYNELFLNGLDECAVMLPEGIARRLALGEDSGYVVRPLIVDEGEFDIRAFYREEPGRPTETFLRALREVLQTQGDVGGAA